MGSCQQCRDAKRKCIPGKDDDSLPSCSRCLRHRLVCSRSQIQELVRKRLEARQPFARPSTESQTQTKRVDDFLRDDRSVHALVHEYLAKIHGRPHSIFHAATLWKHIRERRASKALILAICAMGAHVSTEPTLRSLEPVLTAESKQLLKIDIERVCLENIQTCILVANLCVAHANASSELLFFRKLSRFNLSIPGMCEHHRSLIMQMLIVERDDRNSNCNVAIDGTTYGARARQRSLSRAQDPNLVGAFCSGQLVLFEPWLSLSDEGLVSTD
jgi:hypothetical protein